MNVPSEANVAWLDGPGQLAWRRQALSPAGEGQHLCRAIVSAISPGTELAAWTGAPPLRPGPVYPRVSGYCHVAEVVASGSGVTRAQPGDRVLSFTSHRDAMLLADDEVLAVIPSGLSSELASISYLFHLGYNAVLESGVRAGSRVLVLGLGALGQTAVTMAALAGARVAAISDQSSLGDLALRAGACWTGGRGALADGPDWLAGGADVVISTTNSWEDWQTALAATCKRGTIAVLGFPGRNLPAPVANPLAPEHFYQKQLCIRSVGMSVELPDPRGFARWNERDNLAFLLELLANGTIDASPFTAHSMPATQLADAYAGLLLRQPAHLTTLLQWA